ncbi:hypothetical protein KSP40_PGU016229 [Platanthera guangdongensis]|uniref:C2 NT-type domain-containing protein n=1 Tax=Platanthera guangdongensis TaxID=2320717 RepID=A0ABR2MVV6_9ASPA
MVAKMIRWPWQPIVPRKFVVRLVVRAIEGLELDHTAVEPPAGAGWMATEVRWKGPRTTALRLQRRKVRRNCTKVEEVRDGKRDVDWNEEFENVVRLTAHKENAFNPWEIEFAVFFGVKQVSKNRASVVGTTSLNLAEYASCSGEEFELNLPLLTPNFNADSQPILHLTLKLLELRTCSESSGTVQMPVDDSSQKEDLTGLESEFRKATILAESESTVKSKKSFQEDEGSDGRCSPGSEDTDYTYLFDSDSLDDNPDDEIEYGKADSSIRKSFSYGTLSNANYVDGAFQCDTEFYGEYEDSVYHSHQRSDSGFSYVEETAPPLAEQSVLRMSRRSIIPWRKRKHVYKSPKNKGEPLLKKAYEEEGGDDIDHDRRQLTSSDESFSGTVHKAYDHSSVSDFGDDNFAVGCWESKELTSRDGKMKLFTEVFFASIDQRSERAAGQSACTALVAIIADWFKSNHDMMPIKSQFDSLIREGSLEWRNLCEKQTYKERFPDKHFDLETVLQAKIRPLSVVPGKSFVGFFNPEGCEDSYGFEFLSGAMSFDSIWDEIAWSGTDCLYIVSWNDHFFVLKVERDVYYIIDTLGERLYEGCDQAYILKFDDGTKVDRVLDRKEKKAVKAKAAGSGGKEEEENESRHGRQVEVMVSRGKESCKEYIKSFLAAIPIRELQADIKKGIMATTPLHHRLQIEFHYTEAAKDIINFASISPLPFWGSTLTSGSLLAV